MRDGVEPGPHSFPWWSRPALIPGIPGLELPWEQAPVLGVLAPPRPGSGPVRVAAGLGRLSALVFQAPAWAPPPRPVSLLVTRRL